MSKWAELFAYYRKPWLFTTFFAPTLIFLLHGKWSLIFYIQLFAIWGIIWPFSFVTYPAFTLLYLEQGDYIRAALSTLLLLLPGIFFWIAFRNHARGLAKTLDKEKVTLGDILDYYLGSGEKKESTSAKKESKPEKKQEPESPAEEPSDSDSDTPSPPVSHTETSQQSSERSVDEQASPKSK